MIKFLGRLLSLILAIIFGFWLAVSGILVGTSAGEWMDTLMGYLPLTSEEAHTWTPWNSIEINLPDNLIGSSESSEETNQNGESALFEPEESEEVNFEQVEQGIITHLNNLRSEQGLNALSENTSLREAAYVRAVELEDSFSHTRPDGRDPFTVFDDGIEYRYQIVGENLGMATYYMDESDMSELLFNGWVDSEGHYENMVRPEYEEIGIGVHYDGEYLYAVQMFGTPR